METAAETTTAAAATNSTTTEAPDPDAEVCSGRPFNSFLQLKNGSIYAFRGDYFFELSQKSVLPEYPKFIKDVWGISGPIDAAFTCNNNRQKQGQTAEAKTGVTTTTEMTGRSLPRQTLYFFRGDKYYRVDLSTKRVDSAVPPSPKSMARHWLGCSDPTGADK